MEQNETINNLTTAPKRPTFLTVLCILTFIGSGLGIFNGITTAFMSTALGGIMSEFSIAENVKIFGIATIVASIITLLGAFMMWGLRKMGFWVYVIGVAISIGTPLVIYGGNLMGAFSAIGIGFISIIFIILYGVNRKHLVN